VGKYKNPRCFKNVNLSSLPVTYRANLKSWMRTDIFREWVEKFDHSCRTKNINTLLLVDNASSHLNTSQLMERNIENRAQSWLTNVEIFYLPPNTTAHLQPMDAGIIHSFKANYKRLFCRYLIQQFDEGADIRDSRYFCLPLLIEYFYSRKFLTYGCVV
jgi:hypothetical protein